MATEISRLGRAAPEVSSYLRSLLEALEQFCVYVCDRLVLPAVRDRIDDMAAGRFSLDQATRDYVRTELEFRMVQVTDGREALQVERLVQRGVLAAGRPFLNPLG